jgi:uncharacterized protein YceK
MKTILIVIAVAMLAFLGCSTERAQAPLSSQNTEGSYAGAEAEMDALLE